MKIYGCKISLALKYDFLFFLFGFVMQIHLLNYIRFSLFAVGRYGWIFMASVNKTGLRDSDHFNGALINWI